MADFPLPSKPKPWLILRHQNMVFRFGLAPETHPKACPSILENFLVFPFDFSPTAAAKKGWKNCLKFPLAQEQKPNSTLELGSKISLGFSFLFPLLFSSVFSLVCCRNLGSITLRIVIKSEALVHLFIDTHQAYKICSLVP